MSEIVNCRVFAEMTGFPLATVRRYCRDGLIPHWRTGRVYLMDRAAAMEALMKLQETDPKGCIRVEKRRGKRASPVEDREKSFLDRIQALKKKTPAADGAATGVRTVKRASE